MKREGEKLGWFARQENPMEMCEQDGGTEKTGFEGMRGDQNAFFHIKNNWKDNIKSKVKRGFLEEGQPEEEID